jgi:hypothetical protein
MKKPRRQYLFCPSCNRAWYGRLCWCDDFYGMQHAKCSGCDRCFKRRRTEAELDALIEKVRRA